MPYLIATSVYPSDKATEVAEKYLEAIQKYPPDENLGTPVVPVAAKTTKQGLKVMGITEVKAGKLEEVLDRARNMMTMFNDIVGFESTLDVYMTLAEGLGSLGMSMPE
jgi:hypothetical protein